MLPLGATEADHFAVVKGTVLTEGRTGNIPGTPYVPSSVHMRVQGLFDFVRCITLCNGISMLKA